MATNLIPRKDSRDTYIALLEDEITEDLRRIVSPENLRDEVRKAILSQVSLETGNAVSELHNTVRYGSSDESIRRAEAKALRYMGYLQSLLAIRDSQRLLAAPKVQTEEVF